MRRFFMRFRRFFSDFYGAKTEIFKEDEIFTINYKNTTELFSLHCDGVVLRVSTLGQFLERPFKDRGEDRAEGGKYMRLYEKYKK